MQPMTFSFHVENPEVGSVDIENYNPKFVNTGCYKIKQKVDHIGIVETLKAIGRMILYGAGYICTAKKWKMAWYDARSSWRVLSNHEYRALVIGSEFLKTHKVAYGSLFHQDDVAAIFSKDKALVMQIIGKNSELFKLIDPSLKKDPDIVRMAAKMDYENLKYADQSLLEDKDFITDLIDEIIQEKHMRPSIIIGILEQLPIRLRQNKDFALKMIAKSPWAFTALDNSLKREKEVLLAAFSIGPEDLFLNNSDLMQNKALFEEIGLKYLKKSAETYLSHYPEYRTRDASLLNDKQFFERLLNQNPNSQDAFVFAGENLKKDREFVLNYRILTSKFLEYADKSLFDDEVFLKEAIKKIPNTFRLASDRFKKNKEFVRWVAQIEPGAVVFADREIAKDSQFVEELKDLTIGRRNGAYTEREIDRWAKGAFP